MLFVEGHEELSNYLIGVQPTIEEVTLVTRLLTFTKPFSTRLWALFIFMAFTYGVIIYLLEHPCSQSLPGASELVKGASLSAYSSLGSWLAVSSPDPQTVPGRFVMAFMGFTFIVFAAA